VRCQYFRVEPAVLQHYTFAISSLEYHGMASIPLFLRISLTTLYSSLFASGATAQNYPSITYSTPINIAPGVKSWSGSSAAPNPLWQIRVVEVDLSNPEVQLIPAQRLGTESLERTTSIAARYDALAAMNAGYFSTTGSVSHYEWNNTITAFTVRPPRSAFGLNSGFPRLLAQTPVTGSGTSSTSDPDWLSVTEAIGGGPSLLTNGAVDVRSVEENFDAQSGIGPTVRNPRSALGWNPETKHVWLVTVDGRQASWSVGMTLDEVARLLQDLGATRGLNYDGGGSTVMVVDGAITNRPSDSSGERSVATAWLVIPGYTVDNLFPGFRTAGSWSSSANAGFYGENSLVRSAGTGSDTAIWEVTIQEAGNYRVEARWVAAGNRTPAARYTISHSGGSSLVEANQTTNGSQWNSLGVFSFNPGIASVTLTNQAPAGTFVSADAVRWIREEIPEPTPTPSTIWVTQ
jgi:hypothetical protein